MPISKNRKVIINNIFVIMINKYRKFKFNNFFLSSLPSFVKQHISFKRKIFGYSYLFCGAKLQAMLIRSSFIDGFIDKDVSEYPIFCIYSDKEISVFTNYLFDIYYVIANNSKVTKLIYAGSKLFEMSDCLHDAFLRVRKMVVEQFVQNKDLFGIAENIVTVGESITDFNADLTTNQI